MATYIIENQEPLNDPTEITEAHFGVNLLTTQDVELLDSNDDMLSDLNDLGVSTVRFPGGSVTENTFDMNHPNLNVAPSSAPDAGDPLIPLEEMFAKMAQSPDPIAISLVIPTSVSFTSSAAEAALVAPGADQSYGSRDAFDPDYIGSPWEGEIPLDARGDPVRMGPDVEVDGVLGYVSYALKLADAYGVEVTTLEIGNEFWGAGEMTASEYGFVAAQASLAIDEMLDSPEYENFDVDIVVQTTSSASQLYSPKDDVTAYVAESDGELTLLSMDTINKPFDKGGYNGEIDPSWTEVVIPGQGSAKEQGDAIIAQFNALEGAGDAIDGVVQHYYEDSGLDQVTNQGIYLGPDDGSAFAFQQFNTFQDDLIRSDPEDLTFNITEWNARYNDDRGLHQASMQIEVFYELVANGADVAQAWPLTFDVQGRSLLDVKDPLGGLSISGEIFEMMSESLVGLSPIFDFSVTSGQGSDTTWLLDMHGFGTEDRTVVFVSERSGVAQTDVTLDLRNYIDPDQTYFVTGTELWDGGAGGNNPNAEPVVSYTDGGMVTGTMFDFGINGWANLRLEVIAVGDGDDYVLAREGNDTIETFGGNDIIQAGDGDDYVDGGDGNDQIGGGDGNDTLYGGAGNDTIGSGSGNDFIDAGVGSDVMSGGYGADIVQGGGGKDTLAGSYGDDLVDGGAGDDSLGGGSGRDQLYGGDGNDSIGAGDGDDQAWGGSGNDFIGGGDGNDRLWGEAGNDTLNGGLGDDSLSGGAGTDTFVFNDFTAGEKDTIQDFEVGIDTIRIGGGLSGFSALDFSDVWINGTQYAQIDYDGLIIRLADVASADLSASDFIFT